MENLTPFSYAEMVKRNFGFVSPADQEKLRTTPVFICGVGGMGGACLQSLVRAGYEQLGVADLDVFEVSNLNRQVFANLSTVSHDKAESTIAQIRNINPGVQVENYGADWFKRIDEILKRYKIVVNGCDDILTTILLYRKAREHGVTVVDAYTSPLPSTYVTKPTSQTPEERLNFPTRAIPSQELPTRFTNDIENACKQQEVVHVMVNSSSIRHIDFDAAMEMVAGKRARMSLSMMVITTGNLMAYQVYGLTLGNKTITDEKGFFLDSISGKCERPLSFPMSWIKTLIVRRYLVKIFA